MNSRWSQIGLNTLTVALTVGAMGMVGLRLGEYAKPVDDTTHPTRVRDWRTYADTGLRIGSPDASVKVTTFSDFQCCLDICTDGICP